MSEKMRNHKRAEGNYFPAILLLAILLALTLGWKLNDAFGDAASIDGSTVVSDSFCTVWERSRVAMKALQEADGLLLADLIHPTKGVRFSPYAFVNIEEDQVFTAEAIRGLDDDSTVYLWGYEHGSGLPIEQTLTEYLARFAKHDYVGQGQRAYNGVIGIGNSLNNIKTAYPEGVHVEFHIPGSGGLADYNWSSVRLVFEEHEGEWYLVGVISDQWTI